MRALSRGERYPAQFRDGMLRLLVSRAKTLAYQMGEVVAQTIAIGRR
jgi:hypothetical protein